MLKKLDAFLYGKEIGRFKLHANGTIGFTYDELWTGQDISLSLPRVRPQNNARPFLEGLLP
ncbi:HipA N-terminal domain-containing protein, partial [uncultured Mobiluncus sp.]|uniref:HipA N-terminal domain-containing protein n=1 Tax=uncultured Mobiluncus sp. TaxID=293425 RepID=UPI002609F7B1